MGGGITQCTDKPADQVSVGERQRVGVVRALMQRLEVVFADEPTASFDPKTSEQIMSLLRDLVRELHQPVIISIHNVTEAKEYSGRIVGMSHGHIIFDDKPAALDEEPMDEIYAGTPSRDRQEMGAAFLNCW